MVSKFWLEAPCSLFTETQLVALPKMELASQMNAFTRLTVMVAIIMVLTGNKPMVTLTFLLGALLFIIILYYIQKKMMDTYKSEHYTPSPEGKKTLLPPTIADYQGHSPNHPRPLPTTRCSSGPMCELGLESRAPPPKKVCADISPVTVSIGMGDSGVQISDGLSGSFTRSHPIRYNDPNYRFASGKISGAANPKTLIQPVIAPPITDIDYWRDNSLVEHSGINTNSQFDTYLSGYSVGNFPTGPVNNCSTERGPVGNACNRRATVEGFTGPKRTSISGQPAYPGVTGDGYPMRGPQRASPRQIVSPIPSIEEVDISVLSGGCCHSVAPKGVKEDYSAIPYEIVSPVPTVDSRNPNGHIEGYTHIANAVAFDSPSERRQTPRRGTPGDLNGSCGYNAHNAYLNLPVNMNTGQCDRDPSMSEYNKNLTTATIQPGVFSRSDVNESSNSFLGISHQQQSLPTTSHFENGVGTTYVQRDPRTYIEPEKVDYVGPNEANVYDGRLTGYGATGRGYQDRVTGQPKFMYDDVDSVRMPTYIKRSNIDFMLANQQRGTMDSASTRDSMPTSSIRNFANNAYMESALEHRTSMQVSLMSKRNSELANIRRFPKHTRG